MDIRTKRVYEPADPEDGERVLVDRLWPRGLTKERARTKLWLRDAAPSTALRKWFGHDRGRWEGFKERYFAELDGKPEAVGVLAEAAAKSRLTLLYSARDPDCNQAVALKQYLGARSRRGAERLRGRSRRRAGARRSLPRSSWAGR